MRTFALLFVTFIVFVPCFPTPSRAADGKAAKPPQTGSVRGVVKFKGKQTPAKPIVMGADPFCEKYYANKSKPTKQRWVWGKNNTLQNVVVYVTKGLPSGYKYAPPKKPAELKQQGCIYVPHVLAVQVNQKIRVENLDDTLHNTHSLPRVNKEY